MPNFIRTDSKFQNLELGNGESFKIQSPIEEHEPEFFFHPNFGINLG
jgi:hypothetical protein